MTTSLIPLWSNVFQAMKDIIKEDVTDYASKTDITVLRDLMFKLRQGILAAEEHTEYLEDEVEMIDEWNALRRNYVLIDYDECVVYELREVGLLFPETVTREPKHKLCAHCFQERRKSILQRVSNNQCLCPVCKIPLYM